MGVTTYYSASGELLGHRTDVGAAYGTDALGSVTVTAIENQQRTPTNYYYKPYGSRLNKLGNNADPRYLWNGTSGYRETAISHSKSYVQARHLGQEEGRWTTVDPLWPSEPQYGYASLDPVLWADSLGLAPGCKLDCDKDKLQCNWFYDNFGIPRFIDGSAKGGFIYCCKGECVPCVNVIAGYDEGTDEYDCLLKHEENHCKRANCKGKPDGFQTDCVPDCPNDECMATAAEIQCLIGKRDKRCKGLKGKKYEDCVARYSDRMELVCEYAKGFCKTAGMRFPYEALCKRLGAW